MILFSLCRRVRFEALLALALLASTAGIARAGQSSCTIAVTSASVTNVSNGVVGNSAHVLAAVSHSCQIQSVVASGAGHSIALSEGPSPGGPQWSGDLSLAGVTPGPVVITVTATDALGNSASRDVSIVHDPPPTIVISAPAAVVTARPGLHIAASCQDDVQCVSLSVTASPETGSGSGPVVLVSRPAAIDQDVSLAAFDGRVLSLIFVATDSAGQQTTVNRFALVYVESNPKYVETVHVPGLVLDDSPARTLFFDESFRVSVLEKATGQISVLSPGPGAAAPPGGFLTSTGAVFLHRPGVPIQLYEWRNGDVIDVDPSGSESDLRVKGGYAIWLGAMGLVRKDLVADTTVVVEPAGAATPEVSANGDVVYAKGATGQRQIFRYRDGVQTQLTFDGTADYSYPLTDGLNVVCLRIASTSRSIQLIASGSTSTLSDDPATAGFFPQPYNDYAVNGGWVAFTRLVNGSRNVWVRSPAGAETQLTFFAQPEALIASVDEDGRVALGYNVSNYAGRLLVAQSGAPQIEPGVAWTSVAGPEVRARIAAFWRDGDLYVVVGGSVMQVTLSACTTGTLAANGGRVAAAGGTFTVNVSAAPGCVWGAVSNSAFMTVTNGSSGSGAGTVTVAVAPTPLALARRGRLSIAGQIYTVVQNGRSATPGDFTGAGTGTRAVFRPGTGIWYIEGGVSRQFGLPGDIPVPGDYDGDRVVDEAVYRPATGQWFIADQATIQYGPFTGIPVAADYDGDGVTDIAYYDTQAQLAVWTVRGQPARAFGLASDIPRPADLDGDGRADLVVYRRATGYWFVAWSSTNYTVTTSYQWGFPGDVPLTGDLDGDGMADLIVFRPSDGTWHMRFAQSGFATTASVGWGLAGDVPLAIDLDGDARAELCVFRPPTGEWHCYDRATGTFDTRQFGLPGDIPAVQAPRRPLVIANDLDGDSRSDITVYRPSTGEWYTRLSSTGFAGVAQTQWGLPGDLEAPGDYDGDGRMDTAVFRPSEGRWYVRYSSTGSSWSLPLGVAGDRPVAADYDGDGRTDLAVYHPQTGAWCALASSSAFTVSTCLQWGLSGDRPVPADYDGDGRTDYAVFRPLDSVWYVLLSGANFTTALVRQWGLTNDIPVPADFDGDGRTDLAVYRPSTGEWHILMSQFGYDIANGRTTPGFQADDVPVTGDFDGDGASDFAIYRPATGEWSIGLSSQPATWSIQWGSPGDVPLSGT